MKPILPGSLCLETVMQMVDTCVCCGAPVPEGRQICWICEHPDYAKADEPVRQPPTPDRANRGKSKCGIKCSSEERKSARNREVRDNMTDFNQIKERFDALRKLVMNAIGRELEIDYCGKIYEGILEWTVRYPDCYDDPEAKAGPEFYVLKLHCYLLGPSRHYEWRGRTPEIVLNKAEKEIKSWLT